MEVSVHAANTAGEQDGALLVHYLMKMYAARADVVPEMACELLWVNFVAVSEDSRRGDQLTVENPIIHQLLDFRYFCSWRPGLPEPCLGRHPAFLKPGVTRHLLDE